jgi:hypothetical protein
MPRYLGAWVQHLTRITVNEGVAQGMQSRLWYIPFPNWEPLFDTLSSFEQFEDNPRNRSTPLSLRDAVLLIFARWPHSRASFDVRGVRTVCLPVAPHRPRQLVRRKCDRRPIQFDGVKVFYFHSSMIYRVPKRKMLTSAHVVCYEGFLSDCRMPWKRR